MHLSALGWETFFNIIYFGGAFVVVFCFLIVHRANNPKYYGLIFSAMMLILGAALLFQMYNGSLEIFLAMTNLKPDEEVVRKSLTENLRILIFVVPVVMLAVAANLITQFLNTPKPSTK
jgi:hypothetical protein